MTNNSKIVAQYETAPGITSHTLTEIANRHRALRGETPFVADQRLPPVFANIFNSFANDQLTNNRRQA